MWYDVRTAALCTYFICTNVTSNDVSLLLLLLGLFFLTQRRKICRKIRNSQFHGRLLSLINVPMHTLLCTALLAAPCACAAAVRSSIAVCTTASSCRSERSLLFVATKKHFFVFFYTKQFFHHGLAFFKYRGLFDRFPCFLLLRLSVKAVALTLSVKE